MFEFKYITSAVDIKIGSNIIVSLKNQGGHTNRKASILRDIEKLEKLTKAGKCDEACFILLTNDKGLIKSKSENNALNICDGKQITPITIEDSEGEITIEGTYNLKYFLYYSVKNTTSSNVDFMALILPIKINP